MYAFAITGAPIVGEVNTVLCTANIVGDSFNRTSTGELEFEWSGESEVHWDTEEVVLDDYNDHHLYVDDDSVDWPDNLLILIEADALPYRAIATEPLSGSDFAHLRKPGLWRIINAAGDAISHDTYENAEACHAAIIALIAAVDPAGSIMP